MSGKYSKKSKKTRGKLIAAIVVLALLLLVLLWLAFSGTSAPAGDASSAATTQAQASAPSTVAFPGDLGVQDPQIQESEYLVLSSLYTATILNPDCGGQYAADVAALEVTNTSEQYLLRAELTAALSDGSTVSFVLADLPAGGIAEVFDTQNRSLDSGVTCVSITCGSETYLTQPQFPEGISLADADGGVTITNTGSEALTDLKVVYRCDMGGQYFGGTSYEITIDCLNPAESFTVSDETLIGQLTIVRIYQ